MKRPFFVALVALVAVSCTKKQESAPGAAANRSDERAPLTPSSQTLNGAGSSFQLAFQQAAIERFQKAHPHIVINYGGGGSGRGRQQLADMVVDFGGTDAPYRPDDLAQVKGGTILYFPLLLGPITVSYNVPGVPELRLSAVTIAKIFQREIKTWNDRAISAENAGVKLPATDILVARRSEGSGTTENFTRYLELAAPGTWKLKSGATVEWPTDTVAAPGNGGVAQVVKSTAGAIGYIDLADAEAAGMTFAAIQNGAGRYVKPTATSASVAADGIDVKEDLVFSAINAKGEAAYPITYQTWLITYAEQRDKAKGAALQKYIEYLLTEGQKLLPDLHYAPLPSSLQQRALTQLHEKLRI